MIGAIVILIVCAIFASLVREYYGNKGIFILPKVTEKGLALGSLTSIVAAVFAVLINFALIPSDISYSLAISLGIAWGIAAPDIVANILAGVKK